MKKHYELLGIEENANTSKVKEKKMFTTTVRKRKIYGADKKDLLNLLPLGIWLVVFLVFFAMFCREIYWAAIPCLIDFFSIIPIAIIVYKSMDPYRGKNAFFTEEVTFEIKDGQLYADGQKIVNIIINPRRKEIYVDNIQTAKTQVKGGTAAVDYATFIGTVEEPYMEAFEAYLRNNNIEMEDE